MVELGTSRCRIHVYVIIRIPSDSRSGDTNVCGAVEAFISGRRVEKLQNKFTKNER